MSAEFYVKLAQARAVVSKRAPYFGAALLGFHYVEDPECPTLATSPTAIVRCNPELVRTLPSAELAFGLVHEHMHVLQGYWERAKRYALELWPLFNVACDLAINPVVREMGFPLPKSLTPRMPDQFKFPEGLVAEQYMELLLKGSKGKSAGGACSGHCVSPGKPGEQGARTSTEVKRMARGVAEAARDHAARGRGTVPDSLLRWANGELAPPTIPWRQVLAVAVRRSVAMRLGATTRKYDAPSRRQGGMGHGPGIPVLSRWRREVPEVMVAVDTSGSMGEEALLEALSETDGILRAVGARCTFVACDAEVNAVKPIKSAREARGLLKGGGGTSFAPIFEAFRKLRPRPSVVVLLTDGMGDNPPREKGLRLVVVLVGGNTHSSIDWADDVICAGSDRQEGRLSA